jgi:hypothetical protein
MFYSKNLIERLTRLEENIKSLEDDIKRLQKEFKRNLFISSFIMITIFSGTTTFSISSVRDLIINQLLLATWKRNQNFEIVKDITLNKEIPVIVEKIDFNDVKFSNLVKLKIKN